MKKQLFLKITSVTLLFSINANAQFGIDKLKNKVKEETKETKKDNSSDSKTTSIKKADVESSPAAKSIRNYRNGLSFAKDAVAKGGNDAQSRVEELEKMLAKIKAEDPNWADYSKDEADYLALKQQFDKGDEKKSAYKKLEKMNMAIDFSDHKSVTELLNDAMTLNLTNKDLVKKYYDNHPNEGTDYEKKILVKIDNYFSEKFPAVRTDLLKVFEGDIIKTEKFIKESRAKSTYLSNKDVSFYYPKGDINTIDIALSNIDKALIMFPEDNEFKAKKDFFVARKADLENYINSGDLKKDIEKRELMNIEERRISPAVNKSPDLIAVVKKEVAQLNYELLRTSIVSNDWRIKKNSIDIPLSKSMDVEIAVKKDGKCYKVYGALKCTYEGGGKYTNPHYSTYGDLLEMNCNNVIK